MTKIYYFTAPWCGPCKVFGPVMDEVIPKFDIDYQKVLIDDNPEYVGKYQIWGVPTVVAEIDGKEIDRFSGARNIDDLTAWVAGVA